MGNYLATNSTVFFIANEASFSCSRFHQHLVTSGDQHFNCARCQSNPKFIVFKFFGQPYKHG